MYRKLFASLGLIGLTFAVYQRVAYYPFINLDDTAFVALNPHIHAGLSLSGIRWAFGAIQDTNWQPLVWLSYMLDFQIGGLYPGVYHITNLFFHLANTLLLLIVLDRMTKAYWKSLAVAALFALHPLHVESVAWIAERKDVLSTSFLFLALWAYLGYARRPTVGRYGLVVAAFVLGLMAKPMLVTLPLMLMLLDYWPLGRLRPALRDVGNIALEKLPLFVLALGFSILAVIAQKQAGAVGSWDAYPLSVRLGNAILSYAGYIGKMVWPAGLAVFYPHPESHVPLARTLASAAVILAISIFVFRAARRYPYLATGWLWYIVTLLPVIGLVQIGRQAMADRYTYTPLIGLFIMIVWGAADLAGPASAPDRKRPLKIAMTVALIFLALASFVQVSYWRSDLALFSHALAVTTNNDVAQLGVANACADQGRYTKAIEHYQAALAIYPRNVEAYNNLGSVYAELGQYDLAVTNFRRALALRPTHAAARINLARLLAQKTPEPSK